MPMIPKVRFEQAKKAEEALMYRPMGQNHPNSVVRYMGMLSLMYRTPDQLEAGHHLWPQTYLTRLK